MELLGTFFNIVLWFLSVYAILVGLFGLFFIFTFFKFLIEAYRRDRNV